MLKQDLLNLDIFDNNEYFDKYYTLISNNSTTTRCKGVTQCHHIVPKSFKPYLNEVYDSLDNNLVNLIYKDHILAHYYLERCIKIPELRGKNFFAIYKLCGSAKISKDELYKILENEELLDEFITYKNYNNIFLC